MTRRVRPSSAIMLAYPRSLTVLAWRGLVCRFLITRSISARRSRSTCPTPRSRRPPSGPLWSRLRDPRALRRCRRNCGQPRWVRRRAGPAAGPRRRTGRRGAAARWAELRPPVPPRRPRFRPEALHPPASPHRNAARRPPAFHLREAPWGSSAAAPRAPWGRPPREAPSGGAALQAPRGRPPLHEAVLRAPLPRGGGPPSPPPLGAPLPERALPRTPHGGLGGRTSLRRGHRAPCTRSFKTGAPLAPVPATEPLLRRTSADLAVALALRGH
mmetsp:Transcript_2040/g.7904  ORF Transcript_2040/g.7904 Transcript_2040/m.7904 type:complete len:271 (+) Transcript_2040:413-1225(+)